MICTLIPTLNSYIVNIDHNVTVSLCQLMSVSKVANTSYTVYLQFVPFGLYHLDCVIWTLYSFAKEDKGLSIRYKTARGAFTRIAAERMSKEGQTVSAPSAVALETNGQNAPSEKVSILVFPKKRSSEDTEKAKTQFLEVMTYDHSQFLIFGEFWTFWVFGYFGFLGFGAISVDDHARSSIAVATFPFHQ